MSDRTAADDAAESQKKPPRPRFALAVGVVGHRPDDLAKEPPTDNGQPPQVPPREERLAKLERDVTAALEAIAAAAAQARQDHRGHFDQGEPTLTLVSALAPGADTIAAKAAHARSYRLDAPLPFAKDDYEDDFKTPGAKADFDRLVKEARVLELPGRRRSTTGKNADDTIELNRAYEAAGLTVLSQADIVLAVWDRELSRGRGGTAELVAEAARAGMPIVLVDAYGILPVEVRWRGLTKTPAPIVAVDDLPRQPLYDCINRVVDELIRLPASHEQKIGYAHWLGEGRHHVNLCLAFPLLMAALLARWPGWSDVAPGGPKKLADRDYVEIAKPVIAGERERIAALADPYGWADGAAVHFAQVFRSAFVTNFLFAALAVMAALVSVFFLVADAAASAEHESPSWDTIFSWHTIWSPHHRPVVIEIGLILFVVAVTLAGRVLRWHRRWVEAREVAERLRGALPLWTLGLRPAFFPGEEPTWTGWYTRALVRMHGLRAGKIAAEPSEERKVLLELLAGQASYNEKNAVRMHNAERRLEWVGLTLFLATAAVAVDHLYGSPVLGCILQGSGSPAEIAVWLSAGLPSLATATYGIRVIGDFEGTVHRNEHTCRSIEQLIAAIKQDPSDFALLRARARTAADVLLGDVQSWRLAAESRGLAIPG